MEAVKTPTLRERFMDLNAREKEKCKAYVCNEAGITHATFYRYLREPENMKVRAFKAFCGYLNIFADELLYP